MSFQSPCPTASLLCRSSNFTPIPGVENTLSKRPPDLMGWNSQNILVNWLLAIACDQSSQKWGREHFLFFIIFRRPLHVCKYHFLITQRRAQKTLTNSLLFYTIFSFFFPQKINHFCLSVKYSIVFILCICKRGSSLFYSSPNQKWAIAVGYWGCW